MHILSQAHFTQNVFIYILLKGFYIFYETILGFFSDIICFAQKDFFPIHSGKTYLFTKGLLRVEFKILAIFFFQTMTWTFIESNTYEA